MKTTRYMQTLCLITFAASPAAAKEHWWDQITEKVEVVEDKFTAGTTVEEGGLAGANAEETRRRADAVEACSALEKQKDCKDNADCVWNKDQKDCLSISSESGEEDDESEDEEDAPVTDSPVTDAPVTDVPVVDDPVTNAPVTDAPVEDEPATTTLAPDTDIDRDGHADCNDTRWCYRAISATQDFCTNQIGLCDLVGTITFTSSKGCCDANFPGQTNCRSCSACGIGDDCDAFRFTEPPTPSPTTSPSKSPITVSPTASPTASPTLSPTTPSPTKVPTKSPTLSPTLYPTLFPTLEPTLYPTLFPTLAPSLFPTLFPSSFPTGVPSISPTPAPTTSPTQGPVGLPVCPHIDHFKVCNNETAIISVVQNAVPGVPLPNKLTVTEITSEGVPRRELQGLSALDLISQGDGDGNRDGDDADLEAGDRHNGEDDGTRCVVGLGGQNIQYFGGAYTGRYLCNYEIKDENGAPPILCELFLQVELCIPPIIGKIPAPWQPAWKPSPPSPKPAPWQPAWKPSPPTPKPVQAWQPAWKPSWEAPPKPAGPPAWHTASKSAKPDHDEAFWGWGKSGKTKSSKTPKGGKSGPGDSWGKSGKTKGGKSGTKGGKKIFANSWWRGGLQVSTSESNGVLPQKDGTEYSAVNVAPVVEETKTAAGSRAIGYFASSIVAIIFVGTLAFL